MVQQTSSLNKILGLVHTYPFSFLYGYGFRPSDENDQRKRNFSEKLSRVELFENTVFACTCGQTKTELVENTEDTLSVPSHSAPGA